MASFRCYDNSDVIAPDHNKFSSLSNTIVVAIFLNLCLWRRSLRSNLGGIDTEKLYRTPLSHIANWARRQRAKPEQDGTQQP